MTTKRKLVGAAAIAVGVGVGSIAGAMVGAPSISGAVESAVAPAAHGRGGHVALGAAAEAIGITEEALRDALHDGQSIAEVAAANGVETQVVVDALVAAATARIDERLADGDLTEEEANERTAGLAEHMTALVNGELGLGERRGHGHRGLGHVLDRGLENVAEVIGISEDELRAALEDGQSIAQVAEANGVERQAVVDELVANATERVEALVDRTWGD